MSAIPGVKHKVIGLLSGGKDSCFNLMHCVANGHEIIAIATLQPEPGIDELDSHLYQSVGTQLLPLIAKSMSLPLFTRHIKGKAVERGPEYGDRSKGGEGSGSKGDETEDLTELLRDVLAQHPEATALSSGAILSNYQRLRIEHVCGRLGLVSLAYLWQQPQLPLLESMFRSGLNPVLVKVAGVGLSVDTVGKDLASMMPTFRKLERAYGSHPAGEGGEYETLTVDSPMFSHRLHFTKSSTVVTDPEPYPVAYLKVEEAELVEKADWRPLTIEELRESLNLNDESDGLDYFSKEALGQLGSDPRRDLDPPLDNSVRDLNIGNGSIHQGVRFSKQGRWFAISVDGQTRGEEDIGEELRRCFDEISETLRRDGLSLPLHATHITLLLSSMSLFAPANAVYSSYFGTSPPSRATVAVPLSAGQRVKIEVVGFDDRTSKSDVKVGGRQALHVQSLSYWAPANIGPYSQAIMVNSRLHVAGQIPLIPASLTLPPYPATESPYPHQAVLALQHVGRIIDVLRSKNNTGGGWEGWGESCIAWWARPEGVQYEGVGVVREAWSSWARENDWEDVPVIFVRAKELPRGALVEYQVNLHSGRRDPTIIEPVDQNEDDEEELEPDYRHNGGSPSWESCRTLNGIACGFRAAVFVHDTTSLATATFSGGHISNVLSAKVYHRSALTDTVISQLKTLLSVEGDEPCLTFGPVLEVHDRHGRSAELALDVFGV